MKKILLTPADCALDLGDGSERALYVNQDYILQKLHKVHRAITLMYTYYPNDKEWPVRACEIKAPEGAAGAWVPPYENYFPYRGGREGLRDQEPFNCMKEIRRHGMDVILTLTVDPHLTEEDIVLLAKDLRPYGRLLLRLNHECTGDWFCYTRRASYQEIADFFVMACRVMHTYAPNVKMVLCAGMWQKSTGRLEMEDVFLEAHKAADIWSGDQYLSLHWGWPNDFVTKDSKNYARYSVKAVYEKSKMTLKRLREITGQDKPMVLSEMNADGDVAGPFVQAAMMKEFMELLQNDDEKWLSAFSLYQFRDDGRLGLEVADPNNSSVGIEQPLLDLYRRQLHRPFFTQKIVDAPAAGGGSAELGLPVTLRWGGAEDAEGIEVPVHLNRTPVLFELHFADGLEQVTMMIEFNGWWFYKAPGTKCVDLMSYFFEKSNAVKAPGTYRLRYFLPPADGMNRPHKGGDPYTAADGDWLYNYYAVLPALPEIRLEEKPVCRTITRFS